MKFFLFILIIIQLSACTNQEKDSNAQLYFYRIDHRSVIARIDGNPVFFNSYSPHIPFGLTRVSRLAQSRVVNLEYEFLDDFDLIGPINLGFTGLRGTIPQPVEGIITSKVVDGPISSGNRFEFAATLTNSAGGPILRLPRNPSLLVGPNFYQEVQRQVEEWIRLSLNSGKDLYSKGYILNRSYAGTVVDSLKKGLGDLEFEVLRFNWSESYETIPGKNLFWVRSADYEPLLKISSVTGHHILSLSGFYFYFNEKKNRLNLVVLLL